VARPEQRLEGKAESGGWRCRCPVHGGMSLSIADGQHGRLLLKCWSGCETSDVLRELRRLGLLSGERPAPLSAEEIERRKDQDRRARQRKIARGFDFWEESRDIRDTLTDKYLRLRGLDIFSPYLRGEPARVLRFHPSAYYAAGIRRPALVAKIEHEQHGFVGVSVTYLALDGSFKSTLDPARKFWGAPAGGAVRLGTPRAGCWLAIGEGIESTLSVAQSCEVPGWAALSAYFMPKLALPAAVDMVAICADNDERGTGERLARQAANNFFAEGRRVRIAVPPRPDGMRKVDYNDLLTGAAHATR
jgi:putative DNA primase/helicase